MKEFFTYEQQISKLLDNGLIIEDEHRALEILRSEGYYNLINGYSSEFRVDDKYSSQTTFEDIYSQVYAIVKQRCCSVENPFCRNVAFK